MSRRERVSSPTPEAAPRAEEPGLSGSSIRVVANRTGIAADTLRVWERRYGFPTPLRRPGGSRVYSEDDVARLHLIARALEAGFRPSEVVALAPAELTKLVDASSADVPGRPGVAEAGLAGPGAGGGIGAKAALEGVIEALRADDLVGIRALLRTAAVSLGPRTFVTEVAHPLAIKVGELWAEGVLDVRHEHLLSASLTSQLHLLLGALEDGDRSPSVLLATVSGERHVLGLDMVAVYLAASLAAPRILGGDTPADQITEAARALGVDAVGLSISQAADARVATRAVKAIAEALPSHIELWLGGAGAQAVASALPSAHVVALWPELDSALTGLRQRLSSSPR